MKYLHKTSEGNFYLDHRLTPEVRAMFCAMASRIPEGGIAARYQQIVDAVAEDVWNATWEGREPPSTWAEIRHDSGARATLLRAEERLCEYPLHPRVQEFFDKFVKMYGHSSIMELTGSPSVYSENISWLTAWLLFDSPLCAGQEASTRAIKRKDWPMAQECYVTAMQGGGVIMVDRELVEGPQVPISIPHPSLQMLHDGFFEVFEAEVNWWKEFFSHKANRDAYGLKDKEPFRPALDRARWAIPGTFATGCAHTTSLRERARVLDVGAKFAEGSEGPAGVWGAIRDCYREALPGLAEMGLREAVYSPGTALPDHYSDGLLSHQVAMSDDVKIRVHCLNVDRTPIRDKPRTYLDPVWNHNVQVDVAIQCSLAVARDWHRHRTMYPWKLSLVSGSSREIHIDRHYEAKSETAKHKLPALLRAAKKEFDGFQAAGEPFLAALCLPLGTRVQLQGSGGLRDVLYTMELRAFAHGANFEYEEQAAQALQQLRDNLGDLAERVWSWDV